MYQSEKNFISAPSELLFSAEVSLSGVNINSSKSNETYKEIFSSLIEQINSLGIEVTFDKIPAKNIYEVIPSLKKIINFFLELESDKNLKLHLSYFKASKFATPDDPDFESISNDDFTEYRINLRNFSSTEKKFLKLVNFLNNELKAHKEACFEDVLLLDSEYTEVNETVLARLGANGYAVHSEAKLELGQTAKDEAFIIVSAEHFTDAINLMSVDNPVLLEVGAFAANGISELIEELASDKYEKFREKIRKSRIVLVDAYKDSIKNGKDALKDFKVPSVLSGLTIEFIHLESLDPKDILKVYKDKELHGNIALTRFVNVLDAIESPQVRLIRDKKYRVLGKTGISRIELFKLSQRCLKETNFDVNKIVLLIKESLNQNKVPPPKYFITKLCCEGEFDIERCGDLYNQLLKSLRVYHSYQPISDNDSFSWPGDKKIIWDLLKNQSYSDHFPSMTYSLQALKTAYASLCDNGSILAYQLTTKVLGMRDSRKGNITLTPARAFFVPEELLKDYSEKVLKASFQKVLKSRSGKDLAKGVTRCYSVSKS